MPTSNFAVDLPAGYSTLMPWIISEDTAAFISFAEQAFGAEEIARVLNPDGSIGHAEAMIEGTAILMFDAPGEHRNYLRLTVADARASFDRAVTAGAAPVTDVTYLFWGDEIGRVEDPFGNIWWIQAHVRDVEPAAFESEAADPDNLAAMAYVQQSLSEVMADR